MLAKTIEQIDMLLICHNLFNNKPMFSIADKYNLFYFHSTFTFYNINNSPTEIPVCQILRHYSGHCHSRIWK